MADKKETQKNYDRWEKTCIKFTDKPKNKPKANKGGKK